MKTKEIDVKNSIRLQSRKKRRQLERKLIKAKRNAWNNGKKIPMSIEMFNNSNENEPKRKTKKKKKKNIKKNDDDDEELTFDEEIAKENHRKNLLEDNQTEEANIKKLEKLLGIKTGRKTYLQGFVNDGLDYLLDFCDKTKRKEILRAESDGWEDQIDEEEILTEDEKWLKEKQKKKLDAANRKENFEEKIAKKTSLVKFNDEIQTKFIDEDSTEEDFDDHLDEDDEEEEEEEAKLREDIYGRTIDQKGNLVKTNSTSKYVPPALRSIETTKTDELRRRLHGQLNRLSEKNFPSISKEIERIYLEESRGFVNEILFELYKEMLLSSSSIVGENLLSELALLLSILHVNIGLEIGSFILENFLQLFVEHFHDEIENKTNDNLIQFVSFLYAFSMIKNKLIFDLGFYLLNFDENFSEKRLELILSLLKTVGFLLRKENPIELKNFLQQVRTKSSSSSNISSQSTRFQFLIETITSLKNNDVRKLPGVSQPDRIDRLKKIFRNLIRNQSTQDNAVLNVGLDDFLHVKQRGRWWIVGSAWTKVSQTNSKDKSSFDEQFDDKIRKLAKEQKMNTEIRKIIFGTLLTSEDCDDAVEKLHRLNLTKIQEKEILHVTLHCALNEKTYNHFYTLILQRFCSLDRRFQMSFQYHTWDRFKDLSLLNEHQLNNFGLTLSQLLGSKSITLDIFKNFNFVELTTSTRTFLVDLFVKLFNDIDDRTLKEIFDLRQKTNRKFLREALRLFLSHFILNKRNYSDLIHRRCQISIEQLSIE